MDETRETKWCYVKSSDVYYISMRLFWFDFYKKKFFSMNFFYFSFHFVVFGFLHYRQWLTRSKKISGKEEERLMMHQMQALAQKQVNPYTQNLNIIPNSTSIARTHAQPKRAFSLFYIYRLFIFLKPKIRRRFSGFLFSSFRFSSVKFCGVCFVWSIFIF